MCQPQRSGFENFREVRGNQQEDFDCFAEDRCLGDGKGLQLSPEQLKTANEAVQKYFGGLTLDGDSFGFDQDGDGKTDVQLKANLELSVDKDGDGKPDVIVDLDNDGKADVINVNHLAKSLGLEPSDAARLLAGGLKALSESPDLNGDGKPDILNPATLADTLAKQLGCDPKDVATLATVGAMLAKGETLTPEQKQAALTSADAVIGAAQAALGAGASDLAGHYGALLGAFSGLNGFQEGSLKQSAVNGALAKLFYAREAIIKNHAYGDGSLTDNQIAYSYFRKTNLT